MNSSTINSMLLRCQKLMLLTIMLVSGALLSSDLKANKGLGVLAPSALAVNSQCSNEPQDMSQWCICPPSWINVTCSQLDPGLNYGNPIIQYGCNCGSIIYGPYITDNRVGCGAGTIVKVWNVWTMYGEFTCVQTINVTGGYYGYPYIYWPPDYMVQGCQSGTDPNDLPPPYNRPTWWAPECSQLMYTYYDEVFYPGNIPGICQKIL